MTMNPWMQVLFHTLGAVVSREVLNVEEVSGRELFEVLPLTHIRGSVAHPRRRLAR